MSGHEATIRRGAGGRATASPPAVRLPEELFSQLPAPPPVPTPQDIAAFQAYEISFEIESSTGFHFPAEVRP